MPNERLNAALGYAAAGWHIVPLWWPLKSGCACPKGQACPSCGKHPIIAGGVNAASDDPITIAKWWQRWPDANVGVRTGAASGIIAVDIDPRHQGDVSWAELVAINGQIPSTVESMTGGGGRHIIWAYPPGGRIASRANLMPGIDIRADGTLIVAPPSRHSSGREYVWEAMSDPADIKPAQVPDWFLPYLLSKSGNGKKAAPQAQASQAQAAPAGQPGAGANVKSGARNVYLTKRAGILRKLGFSQAAIEATLLQENKDKCVPPLPDDEVKTIAKSVSRYTPKGQVPGDPEIADMWLAKFPQTHYGLGEFRRYTVGHWPAIPLDQVYSEVLALCEDAAVDGLKTTKSKLDSIVRIAQIKSQLSDPSEWNSHLDLLVVQNGTLHLSTGVLRPHAPEDYLTSAVNFPYDPSADAPTWEWYFQTTIPTLEKFLQEFAGYSLTLDTSHEISLWLYGPAGCGKSTFIEGITNVLGSSAGLLGLADIERSSFGLSNIPGKTLLVSTEQPATYVKTADVINKLISGEPVTVDRKYRDSVTITPNAKILWAMNELPRIGDVGNGLFRRVKIVEFPDLPESRRNPKLKAMIRNEASGILNWALDGLRRLQTRGSFEVPAEVKTATQDFKDSNNIPKLFLEECTDVDPNGSAVTVLVYSRYKDWCMDNGYKYASSRVFVKNLERMGLRRAHMRAGDVWNGIRLKSLIP